jgi:UDP-2,3-diacylglucosamine pyrophosphatase LpxH
MQVRSVFISDVHLGIRACQADRLVDFLREHPSEHLYLIGDIVDFWAMSRGEIHWSRAQNTFVQKVLRRGRHGNQIIFVPGNHDEALREYVGMAFGDVRLEYEYVHVTADGKRFLLLHGDEFDQVTRYHRWVAILGDVSYNFLVSVNMGLSWFRRTLGRPGYWSLAGYAKRKVKTAVNFIFDFEDSVLHHVRERGFDDHLARRRAQHLRVGVRLLRLLDADALRRHGRHHAADVDRLLRQPLAREDLPATEGPDDDRGQR